MQEVGPFEKVLLRLEEKQAQEAAQGTSISDYVQGIEVPQVMMKGESVSWILDSGLVFICVRT